jgi:hypothetical protein
MNQSLGVKNIFCHLYAENIVVDAFQVVVEGKFG